MHCECTAAAEAGVVGGTTLDANQPPINYSQYYAAVRVYSERVRIKRYEKKINVAYLAWHHDRVCSRAENSLKMRKRWGASRGVSSASKWAKADK